MDRCIDIHGSCFLWYLGLCTWSFLFLEHFPCSVSPSLGWPCLVSEASAQIWLWRQLDSPVWGRVLPCGPITPSDCVSAASALDYKSLPACWSPFSLPQQASLGGGRGRAIPSTCHSACHSRRPIFHRYLTACLHTCFSILHLPSCGCKWNTHNHGFFLSLYLSPRGAKKAWALEPKRSGFTIPVLSLIKTHTCKLKWGPPIRHRRSSV